MSDDGRLLTSGGVQTAAISIWDVQTGAIVREVADGRLSPRSLTFVGNDTLVAINDNGRVLRLRLGDGSIFQQPYMHDMSAMASVVLDETRLCTAGS